MCVMNNSCDNALSLFGDLKGPVYLFRAWLHMDSMFGRRASAVVDRRTPRHPLLLPPPCMQHYRSSNSSSNNTAKSKSKKDIE